jgi:hypothetical protein
MEEDQASLKLDDSDKLLVFQDKSNRSATVGAKNA